MAEQRVKDKEFKADTDTVLLKTRFVVQSLTFKRKLGMPENSKGTRSYPKTPCSRD